MMALVILAGCYLCFGIGLYVGTHNDDKSDAFEKYVQEYLDMQFSAIQDIYHKIDDLEKLHKEGEE